MGALFKAGLLLATGFLGAKASEDPEVRKAAKDFRDEALRTLREGAETVRKWADGKLGSSASAGEPGGQA